MTAPRLIVRSVLALERIASTLDRIAIESLGIDLTADAQAASMTERDLERSDAISEIDEELIAAIEILEEQGHIIPAESYRKLGLDVPRKEEEPIAEEPDQPMPEEPPEPPDPDEPITARRQ